MKMAERKRVAPLSFSLPVFSVLSSLCPLCLCGSHFGNIEEMDEPFDEVTAYHEAGHAVVALALGRPVDRVSILPDRVNLGLCEFRKGVFRPSEDWVEREILIALAGPAAEAQFTGDYAWDGAARDYRF